MAIDHLTIDKIAETDPADFYKDLMLANFYKECGVDPDDLMARYRAISGWVHLPNWDYSDGSQPPLYMLEAHYLLENTDYH